MPHGYRDALTQPVSAVSRLRGAAPTHRPVGAPGAPRSSEAAVRPAYQGAHVPHPAQFRRVKAHAVVQSAVLQLLKTLCDADERDALVLEPRLLATPTTDASREAARYPITAGSGRTKVEFLVRPFHSKALRASVPHLSLAERGMCPKAGRSGRSLDRAEAYPANLLTLPPECLLFGDQLPATHRDAFPTYTNRSALWSTAMLLLHFTRQQDAWGLSPLLVSDPGPVGSHPSPSPSRAHPSLQWRYPAPRSFVERVETLLTAGNGHNRRLVDLVGARYPPADVAHYVWGLVEMLGWPEPETNLGTDARHILAHSSLWQLLCEFRGEFRYAFMTAPDAPRAQLLGWLQGIYLPPTSLVPPPEVADEHLLAMRSTMRRLRPTMRAMLHWDQWRGRHRADIILRRVLGALVDGPLVCHLADRRSHQPPARQKRSKSPRKSRWRGRRPGAPVPAIKEFGVTPNRRAQAPKNAPATRRRKWRTTRTDSVRVV